MAVCNNSQLAVLFVTLLVAMQVASGLDVMSGPFDSSVVTANKEPSITISNSANSQIVQFDDLPREIQEQVVEALHQQQTLKEQPSINKLEQQQDQQQLSRPAQVIKDQSVVVFEVEKQPAVQGSGNADNTDPAKDELELTEEQQGQLAMMLLQEQDVMQQIQQQQQQDGQQLNDPAAVSSGPFIVDSDQLPPEVRHEIIRQFNEQYERAQHVQQRDGQQNQNGGGQSSDEELAQVLTRMFVDDGNGNQFVDMDGLSEGLRAQVTEYLIRQQLDKEGKEEKRQQFKQTSNSNADKHGSTSQLGGVLGSLIGGAVGGYPTQGNYGYPQHGGYPQQGGYPQHGGYPGGYPQQGGYPIGGYPSGGYPGGGYPGGSYPGGGYPQQGGYPGGYPGSGYPQQGSYPGGQYPTTGNRPNRPLGSGYGRPYWGLNIPQYQGQQRPFGILVTREQLAAMMSGSSPLMNDGQVVVAQPSFIGQVKPQDPFASIYQQLYQQSQLNGGQQAASKYGRYRTLPIVAQQRKQHMKYHQMSPQAVNDRYPY